MGEFVRGGGGAAATSILGGSICGVGAGGAAGIGDREKDEKGAACAAGSWREGCEDRAGSGDTRGGSEAGEEHENHE